MDLARFSLWGVGIALFAALGCSDERPPGVSSFALPDAATSDTLELDGFRDGPPPPDASGLCGNEFFQVTQEAPNLYFVLDRSGSMMTPLSAPKYDAVQAASVEVVRQLGHRANVGAAVFPGNPDFNECGAGLEVFPTRPGDPPGTPPQQSVTLAFSNATQVEPKGGTPIAPTLESITTNLSLLTGKTNVVLATDGGPNCSVDVQCEAADCMWNIEEDSLNGVACDDTYNCCDPTVPNGPGVRGCLDAAATLAAVQHLRDQGIRTYVVGIAGSEFYAELLDQFALVGGTGQYYRVDDVKRLTATLLEIGVKVLVTCDFMLDAPPPEPGKVNVYFDQELIPYDPENGWAWTGEQTLSLYGETCARLERGEVVQVQVVAGCPTAVPR